MPYYPPSGGGSSSSAGLAGTQNYYLLTSDATAILPNSLVIVPGSSATSHITGSNYYINAITSGGGGVVYAPTGGYYVLTSGNSTLLNGFTVGLNTTTSPLLWMSSAAMIPQVMIIVDSQVLITRANSANHFRVTLAASRTLGNPISPIDGQKIVWEFIQDATGGRTISFATSFAFGTDIPSGFSMSTGANARNFLGAIYNSATAKLYVVSVARGF